MLSWSACMRLSLGGGLALLSAPEHDLLVHGAASSLWWSCRPLLTCPAVVSNPQVAVVHDHPTKGRAVVARESLPPHTFVGIYGGNLYLTSEYSAMVERGQPAQPWWRGDSCC